MNDERVMILKMLREEKISVEEADALLQALDSRPEEETGFGAGTDRSEEPRDDDRGGSGRTKKKRNADSISRSIWVDWKIWGSS
jgi:hypothetical protein